MTRIEFQKRTESSSFYSPLAGMEWAEQTIEVRTDPLTGMTAGSSSELTTKEEMFYGSTDWDYATDLAATGRQGCFFCPEKVMETTPRYPDELVPGGRLQLGRAIVFPNLFPLAAVHAVVTFPSLHFLRPSEFTPDLLTEGLSAAADFIGRAEAFYPGLAHIELCCNNMLPAGASMTHPHFQVFGGETVPWMVDLSWKRAAEWERANGAGYWQTLVEQEAAAGERFIAARDGVTWMTPWAPTGGREVIAVVPGTRRAAALAPEQISFLAKGLSSVLAWYEREELSAFNFTLFGAPLDGRPDGGSPVIMRVIARTAFRKDYRTDDYFLQKQLGGELIFLSPEQIAATLRPEFAG